MTRTLALVAGPLAAVLTWVVPAPAGLTGDAWRVAGAAAWMALWWLTSVVPLEATGLIPLVLFPALGVGGMAAVAAHYADPVIFLFLGGLLLGATIERWDLQHRLAAVVLRRAGARPRRTVLAVLATAAFMSMWVSNTATAIMLLPLAVALARRDPARLGPALVLAVAYGASLGGVATLIGTPPVALLAASAPELAGRSVSFAGWLPIGLACAIPLLAATWVVLVRVFRVDDVVAPPLPLPPPRALSGGERVVLTVLAATAAAWILREPKDFGFVRIPGLVDALPAVSDAGIAMGAGLLLLVLPLRGQRFATPLDWDTARHVPWGVLLLFGGGLALAAAVETSGLADWLGRQLGGLAGLPLPVILLATTTLFVALTELTSNTATAALGIPLVAGVAGGLGLAPWPLMAATTLACSMGFMLPAGTPPNTIAFASRLVTAGDLARAGWRLNALSIIVISVTGLLLA